MLALAIQCSYHLLPSLFTLNTMQLSCSIFLVSLTKPNIIMLVYHETEKIYPLTCWKHSLIWLYGKLHKFRTFMYDVPYHP